MQPSPVWPTASPEGGGAAGRASRLLSDQSEVLGEGLKELPPRGIGLCLSHPSKDVKQIVPLIARQVLEHRSHTTGLILHLPPGAERTGRNRRPVDWADELLRTIEQAAAQPVGTLITFTAHNNIRAAGFTAHPLTGDDHPLITPPRHPAPDPMPQRPTPATWASPIPRPDSTTTNPQPHRDR